MSNSFIVTLPATVDLDQKIDPKKPIVLGDGIVLNLLSERKSFDGGLVFELGVKLAENMAWAVVADFVFKAFSGHGAYVKFDKYSAPADNPQKVEQILSKMEKPVKSKKTSR